MKELNITHNTTHVTEGNVGGHWCHLRWGETEPDRKPSAHRKIQSVQHHKNEGLVPPKQGCQSRSRTDKKITLKNDELLPSDEKMGNEDHGRRGPQMGTAPQLTHVGKDARPHQARAVRITGVGSCVLSPPE